MQKVFYITNDIERAAVPEVLEGIEYRVVTYKNPYSQYLASLSLRGFAKQSRSIARTMRLPRSLTLPRNDRTSSNIFLVDGKKTSTEELMRRKEVIRYIKAQRHKGTKVLKPHIIVFKPTIEIEEFCKKMGWKLLNPFSKISQEFEEKISQIRLLKSLNVPVPKHIVAHLEKCDFKALKRKLGSPFVVQYNLGHTGEGTLVIQNREELEILKKKFPKRPVRVSEFIEGVPVTINAVVGKDITVSSPSLQITGVPSLTSNQFATVGNDWSWGTRNLELVTRNSIREITEKIGKALKRRGFRGTFGVDVMRDKRNNLYVIEVNSRQPASVVYESYLQVSCHSSHNDQGSGTNLFPERSGAKSKGHNRETTMSLHLRCLLGKDTGKEKLPETLEGSQIFVRAKEDMGWRKEIKPAYRGSRITYHGRGRSRPAPTKGDGQEYFIFSKLNKGDAVRKNAELFRIQSRSGMIEKPMRLKKEVEKIVDKYCRTNSPPRPIGHPSREGIS